MRLELAMLAAFLSGTSEAATLEAVQGIVAVAERRDETQPEFITELPRKLLPDQYLWVGYNGRARIRFDDGTEAVIGPGSEFRNVEAEPTLSYGHARINAKGAWKIRAKNSVLNMQGGELLVEASSNHVIACAFEGTVSIQAEGWSDRSAVIERGTEVVIDGGGGITDPVTADPSAVEWWNRQTSLLRRAPDWSWEGPVAVEALDPKVERMPGRYFGIGMSAWSRFVQSEVRDAEETSITPRLGARFALFPSPSWVLYTDVHALFKKEFEVEGLSEPKGIRVHELFLNWRKESGHSFSVGRQEWEFGGGLMIGKDPWGPVPRDFDGALFALRTAPVRLRAFAAPVATGARLAGVYADLSALPIEGYLLWFERGDESFGVLGERFRWMMLEPLFIDEEIAFESGATSGLAYLAHVRAGIEKDVARVPFGINAAFLQAAPRFREAFPSTHQFLGLIEAYPEMRNIRKFGGSASAGVGFGGQTLTAQLDLWRFEPVSGLDQTVPASGSEIDLQVQWEPIPRLFVQAGAGYLTTPAHLFFAQAQFHF